MKANDCKLIRRDIEEMELGKEPRSNVQQHIEQCSSCREFFESDRKVRQMVGSLTPVEAPADFDFRLSARIAQHSSRRVGGWNFSLAIPSAVVAALALVVVGIFAFRSSTVQTNKERAANVQPSTAQSDHKTDGVAIKADDKPSTVNGNEFQPTRGSLENQVPFIKRNQTVAQRRGGLVIQDSSSRAAKVIRNEQPIDGLQPELVFPMQTFTVSVDDAKGVSRTISIPSVSFGSQRVLAGNGSSYQTPSRTNW
jgi:hypothetical protein